MIKKERQDQILEIIKERKYCTVAFLSKHLFVAPITIRRDLTEMEDAGLVTRCFGGATVPEYENREIPFEVRERQNAAIKDRLAQKAAKLIRPGDVVMMDASTTVSHIADYLTEELDLTVITSSTLVARKLQAYSLLSDRRQNGGNLLCAGGQHRGKNRGIPLCQYFLFFGAGGR